ncbi:MAG: trigger factor [Spirochaetes bacterium]|nr:trigger factor [Spirochaetota bacterium]
MVANKQIERLEHSSAKLTITVTKDEVRKAYDELMAEHARNVRLDGFRQGKVPVTVLERKYGNELRVEAMGRIMDRSIQEALEGATEQPLVYSTPTLQGEPEFSLDSDLTFAVVYDIFPEVKIGDTKGIEFEVPACDISRDDEKRELQAIRERNAIVVDKDDGARTKKGDIVTVNYRELGGAGETIPGTERQDFVFEIGTGYNIYKFDDEVEGMEKNAEKVIEKTFPADFEYKELAGATKRIAVVVTQVKTKKLPEVDDELAQDISEKFKTLDDLKADIRGQLDRQLEQKLRAVREKGLIDGLIARSEIDLPDSMMDAELEMRRRNLMQQMGISEKAKLERLLSKSGRTLETLYAEWRPNAERSIKTRLLIEKLVADGKYEASDEDVAAEYARMSEESSMSVEEIKAEYERREMVEYLRDRVREDKLMVVLLADAKVKKGKKVAFVDLIKENE